MCVRVRICVEWCVRNCVGRRDGTEQSNNEVINNVKDAEQFHSHLHCDIFVADWTL